MIVADDLDTAGCEYYRKALAVFESLVPGLQGERAETQGGTVQLLPFRKRNEEYRSMLKSKRRVRSIIRASDVLQDNAIRDPADFGVVSSAVCRDLRFLDTSQILAPQIIPKVC